MPWTWAASEPGRTVRHRAYYTDGHTAERHEVAVQAGRNALHLTRADAERAGERLDEWPYPGLYTAEEVYGEAPVRLRHRARGEATLTLASPALLDEIRRLGGPGLRGRSWLRPSLTLAAVAGVLALGVIAAGLWGLPRLLAPLAHVVPASWEQALGERVVERLTAERPACTGEAGQAALTALTARLTKALGDEDGPPYPLHVRVLPDAAVNAFAAPGGHVLLLNGLLEEAEGPAVVAGVLAHEIAHAARRDPLQGLIRAAGTSLLVSALVGDRAALDAAAARFAQMLVLFSYSREAELAADRLAVRMLNRADISAAGLADFLRRLQARGAAVPALLSTHPVTAERIALIEAEATGGGDALTPAQWEALRTICRQR